MNKEKLKKELAELQAQYDQTNADLIRSREEEKAISNKVHEQLIKSNELCGKMKEIRDQIEFDYESYIGKYFIMVDWREDTKFGGFTIGKFTKHTVGTSLQFKGLQAYNGVVKYNVDMNLVEKGFFFRDIKFTSEIEPLYIYSYQFDRDNFKIISEDEYKCHVKCITKAIEDIRKKELEN